MNDETNEPTAGRPRKKAVAVAAAVGVAALVGGGLAAGALSSASASSDDSGGAGGRHGYGGPGGAGGPGAYGARPSGEAGDASRPMRSDEKLLTGTTKTKVEAAVKAKYPQAIIERSETDSTGVYEAHIVDGGKPLVVLVGKDFTITGTETGPTRGPSGGGPGGGVRGGGPSGGGPSGGSEGERPTPPATQDS